MMPRATLRWGLLAVFFLAAVCARAQNAEVAGLVRDPSSAVVPNATLTIRNLATGYERKTQGNDAGAYSFPALPSASYRIEVSKAGFQTLVRNGLALAVGERAQVDFALKIGATAETVTVTGESDLLQTADPAVATVVDSQFVANLPLNGRSL